MAHRMTPPRDSASSTGDVWWQRRCVFIEYTYISLLRLRAVCASNFHTL